VASKPKHNFSGIVLSDHPRPGDGWIKGWLPAGFGRRIVIVTAHSNPATVPPNHRVFCTDSRGVKHCRVIVAGGRIRIPVTGDPGYDESKSWGDVAVLLLDEAFPATCTAYGRALPQGKDRVICRKLAKQIAFRINPCSPGAWLIADPRNSGRFEAGDSGLPWFVERKGKLAVISHTARGMWGEGPAYGSPAVWKEVRKKAKELMP
jgi:hypothetical protein